jgi:hypothetical protein
MILGQTYEDTLRVVTGIAKDAGRAGLHDHETRNVAKAFGQRLRFRHAVDLDEDYGMLRLDDHMVILRNGLVINPAHQSLILWDVHDYLRTHPTSVHGIFLLE